MQKEIRRLISENNLLEKNMLILEKDQEVDKRVEIEKFVRQNSEDRENIESKYQLEMEKVTLVYKEKEENLINLVKKANKEVNKLKYGNNQDSKFDMKSINSFKKQVAELTKELEIMHRENKRLREVSETQLNQIQNAPVQFINQSEDEDDLTTVLKLNQKLENQLELKDEEIEELNGTFQSLIFNEKQACKLLKDKLSKNRGKYEERKAKLLQIIAGKDDEIEMIKLKLNTLPSSDVNTSGYKYGRNSDLANISPKEYTLLRMCQDMVDFASRMECK